MALNAYDNCPCGSGKKFKWCCQSFFDQIERAIDQQQKGQHDSALRTMEECTKKHADKPQVWCYFANILASEGKTDQAEESLQKALSIQPDFPMALLLRGHFRLNEGEVIGALMLFRRAADHYSPDAAAQLADVYELIARQETRLNHPVAARAAMERALHLNPADGELRAQFELVFGQNARLPRAARKKYVFRPTGKPIPPGADTGRLSDARRAFEAIAAQFPNDAAAHFNLGVVLAWLGENGPAIVSLNKSLELENDDFRAEETGALIEVLKCSEGNTEETDFQEHRIVLQIRDGEAVYGLLQAWESERRIIGSSVDRENSVFTALIVEELPSLIDTGTTMARVVANLMVGHGFIRLWHPNKENVDKICQEIRDRLTLSVGEPMVSVGPVNFHEIGLEALAYPLRAVSTEEAEKKMLIHSENYLLETIPNRPFKALNGVTPLDATGSPMLRKKLLGLLRFLEDNLGSVAPMKRKDDAEPETIQFFDFEKLRRKLGLTMCSAEAPSPGMAAAKRDFAAMGSAELGMLTLAELSTAELEDAMRAAIKLQSHELAVNFAREGASRPIDAEKPDRYAFYACMMTGAVVMGNNDEAIRALTEGRAWDVAHNEGKRANEYGLRAAAFYAKQGQLDKSVQEFDQVIDRNPAEGNLYVKAAETMLSVKNGAKARYFAEKGMTRAKSQGNRDLQAVCEELLAAAKKLM